MILHVDMDAFFAAVEQRDNPALKGKPIVVSGLSKRSVVSTASYEARKFGIHSAMPVFQAKQRCNHLIILPGNRHKYLADSRRIMDILRRFSPLVEPVSIDEAYVDIAGCTTLFGSARQMGTRIKEEIYKEIGLTCSIGIAPVKFMAKIASDMNKPNGLTLIERADLARVIQTLPIEKVPGVGKQAMKTMASLQIKTLGDVRRFDPALLNQKFGKMGKRISDLCLGIDTSPVETESQRKSISSETTLPHDISDPAQMARIILDHSQGVGQDLRRRNWLCSHVSIKIKFSDFTQITRGKKTSTPISSSRAIYEEAMVLFNRLTLKKKVRLMGVGVSDFTEKNTPMQMSLLPDPKEVEEKQWESVDLAVDAVLEKFGSGMVRKASLSMPRPAKHLHRGGDMTQDTAVSAKITGIVQGVCYRAYTRDVAVGNQLKGYVKNCPDGSVQAFFQGHPDNVKKILAWCKVGPPHARVSGVTQTKEKPDPNLRDFQIRY